MNLHGSSDRRDRCAAHAASNAASVRVDAQAPEQTIPLLIFFALLLLFFHFFGSAVSSCTVASTSLVVGRMGFEAERVLFTTSSAKPLSYLRHPCGQQSTFLCIRLGRGGAPEVGLFFSIF